MVKEFGFTVEYRPGSLAEVLEALGNERVNVDGVAGIAAQATGFIRLVTDDPGKTRNILQSLSVDFEEKEALVVDLPNHPGELASLLGRLSSEGIDVLSCYAGVERNKVVLTVDQVDKAKQILRTA